MDGYGKKRKALCISEKVEIIEALDSGLSNAEVCAKFNKKSSTVSTKKKIVMLYLQILKV